MRNNPLRDLAKSTQHQLLYREAKNLGLKLFNNNTDLGKLQIIYLSYLELYKNLYEELGSGEEYLTEEVINDCVRCDAYLVYRRDKRDKKEKPKKKGNSNIPWVIHRPPKRN